MKMASLILMQNQQVFRKDWLCLVVPILLTATWLVGSVLILPHLATEIIFVL